MTDFARKDERMGSLADVLLLLKLRTGYDPLNARHRQLLSAYPGTAIIGVRGNYKYWCFIVRRTDEQATRTSYGSFW